MKAIAAFLVFLFSFLPTLSRESPFKIERMQTDFRGVTTNGKSILCYGNYGIITYTLDYGATFQQLNIGDKYSIKNIKSIGNNFIGATENSLLKSTDNGITWKNNEIFDSPQIIDAAIHNSVIYLLTSSGVYSADSNLNLNSLPIIVLDSNAEYSELETDGNDIFIIYNKKNILHYSVSSKRTDTVDVIEKVVNSTPGYTNVLDLKLSGNTLYLMLNSPEYTVGTVNNYFLAKSDTKGKKWKSISGFIFTNGCYIIDSNSVYGLVPTRIGAIITSQYIHIDTSLSLKYDSTDYTVLNDKYYIDRTISNTIDNPYAYSELLHISKDTLIAVGTNKLITMSYDGGKSWELKSFFRGYYNYSYELGSFPSKDLGYVQNYKSFYTTRNGAITWLPQMYKNNIPTTGRERSNFFFNSNGLGYIRYITKNPNDTNLLVTKDFGNTYNLYYNDSISHFKYDNTDKYIEPNQGIDLGNTILYTMTRKKDTSSYYTIVLRYDTNFRLIDTVKLNCRIVVNTIRTQDSIIFILGLNYSGDDTTDSSGTAGNYKYSYFILKSGDKGKTWDSNYVPIHQEIFKYDDGTYHYINNLYYNFGSLADNYILYPAYPTSSILPGYSILYRYDYKNNIFDSTKIPMTISLNSSTIFSLGSTVFVTSYYNNKFFYTKDIGAKNLIWDSLTIADIFSNWDGYDPTYLQNDKDAILSFIKFDDTSGFLFVGKSMNGAVSKQFKINPVKISLTSTPTVLNEPKLNQERAFLANFYPYPIPGKNVVKCLIYWNPFYDIAKDGRITVYDMYGRSGDYSKVKVNKLENYTGILEWDCTDASPGVYVIQISLGGESHSFPVIVVK
jgi:hypothetical protein